MLEGTALEVAHQGLGGVLEMVRLLLLDATLEARLRPAALVVLAEDDVVDLLYLAQAVGRTLEDARVAAADESDEPAFTPLQAHQRADQRRVADRHLAADRTRQLQRLEQARGLA